MQTITAYPKFELIGDDICLTTYHADFTQEDEISGNRVTRSSDTAKCFIRRGGKVMVHLSEDKKILALKCNDITAMIA